MAWKKHKREIKVARSAISGRFVKMSEAKKKRKTTVIETIKRKR